MVRYFEALRNATPNRVKIFSYGKTWKNHLLMYMAISNANNITKLVDISANKKRLADTRVTSNDGPYLSSCDAISCWVEFGWPSG